MKRSAQRILSLLLAVVLLAAAAPIAGLAGLKADAAEGKKITGYKTGDMISFGSYPQTEVKDEKLAEILNSLPATWISYEYMAGSGSDWDNGTARASDYMKYCDVSYDGETYRGVTFTTYRKWCTNYTSDTSGNSTEQDNNGYYVNNYYWFKYEPLVWRVLDPSSGLVICEKIIDAQPFNNFLTWYDADGDGSRSDIDECFGSINGDYYANNYAESSLRKWLNADFHNLAFNRTDSAKIVATTRENKAWSGAFAIFDSKATTDKVGLLSYGEAQNTSYGFSSNVTREAYSSDYALCQGLDEYSGMAWWWLRSAGSHSGQSAVVSDDGKLGDNANSNLANVGIRPILNLDTSAEFVSAAPPEKPHVDNNNDGVCDDCGKIIDEAKHNSVVSEIILNAPQGDRSFDYKTTLLITATAEKLPAGYKVVICDGDKVIAEGGSSVTAELKKMTKGTTLTSKVVDPFGNTIREQSVNIKVSNGFLDKLVAFFRTIFGRLPVVSI